jgi:hypothetical protein
MSSCDFSVKCYTSLYDHVAGVYDWSVVEEDITTANNDGRHVIIRFWDMYPGSPDSLCCRL